MTDYKNTLNLPQTGFSMKADLVAREPQRLAQWEAQHLYQKIQARRVGAKRFVLHDGPPFANGDVHIGTALNKILKDIIVKYRSARGQDAPYIPGWDCHGLPIEYKVTQEMRKAGQTAADPAAIRSACEASARKFIDIQRGQFKRLGVLGDWEHPYLTLDRRYEADELRLFADIVEKGLVYRGKKPVYWSIPARTALAEAEIEYHDHTSQSIFVKFPVVGEPGTFVVIWTTTPWTLPANLAVAYNSTFTYSLARVGGEQFWVLSSLLASVAEKCHWAGYETVRTALGNQLASLRYEHPFCRRGGVLLAGDAFVESSTGTGFVHIAPGHGLDDYNLGRQHGLPIYSPVDDDGCFAWTSDLPEDQQMPREMIGKSILEKHGKSDANVAVLHELRARNALLHEENYHHSYPFCWRSKTPIIFRAMDQWFIGLERSLGGQSFRQAALAEIDRVAWIPEWGVNRIKGAVATRPDWCISRQRSWGVPLPAFYGANGEGILDAQIARNVADLIEEHGSNVWFEKSASELWAAVKPKNWNGPEAAAKSSDTLDVWIDSGSSSRAVLMRRAELGWATAGPEGWQADVYLEGSDQHRGWFQSSLLLSLAGNGAAPYRTVLTHGFMVDAEREKISKSKQGQGAYEKPQTAAAYVSKYGADVVRLWVASQDYRSDIVVSDERINKVAETYRHLRNTVRYELSNLYDFDPGKHAVPDEKLTAIDRWILARFSALETDVAAAYDHYEFHAVYQKISQFATVELSAIYHDVVKDRLYTDAANSRRRRSTQTALHRMVRGLCEMLSPILAFTADEAWEFIPDAGTQSVHLAVWEPVGFELSGEEKERWEKLFEIRDAALLQLEKERQARNIGKALEARVIVSGAPKASGIFEDEGRETLRELLNVSEVIVRNQPDAATATVEVARAEGQKCERCWHWERDVGADARYPGVCGRCVAAIGEVSKS
jgi:isoleucyl-tRNA synthetase